jgi:hypothetical protein
LDEDWIIDDLEHGEVIETIPKGNGLEMLGFLFIYVLKKQDGFSFVIISYKMIKTPPSCDTEV